jgi:glyoxylase-like metal-dependent hydrolase (beta-lactamase superfamily II)
MKRVTALSAFLAFAVLSLSIRAFQPQGAGQGADAAKVISVDKLKDNLFVLKGGGGNTAVFVGTNGVVVVDTKLPGWGQPLLAKIKELTGKPIIRIVNTHSHYDHTSGNVEFPPNVEIVTHENTPAYIEKWALPTGIAQQPDSPFKANPGKGRPTKTFKDKLSLDKGADRIDLYYFGRGHTGGDAWVVFPALGIAHVGDIFAGKNLPILDANNGGSGLAIGDSLAKGAVALKDITTFITGHSANVMTLADLKEYSEFNKDFLAAVREGKKAGKSVDAIANEWKMPAKYQGYGNPQVARVKVNVQVVYDELK